MRKQVLFNSNGEIVMAFYTAQSQWIHTRGDTDESAICDEKAALIEPLISCHAIDFCVTNARR